jgi:outer membrane protein TolC
MKRILTLIIALLPALMLSGISLSESLELAQQNNKALLMAREDIFKADQTYYDVRGNLLPQLTLQSGYQLSTTYLPDSSLPPASDISSGLDSLATDNDHYLGGALDYIVNSMVPSSPIKEGSLGVQLQFQQVLFLGGKLINGIRAVDRYRSIQRLRYDLVEQDVVLTTTELFYQCLLAGKLLQVQEEGLQTARLHLNRVEAFQTEGQVSEFDLLRARLEVAKLEPQVLQARNTYQLACAAFRKQIGSDDESVVPEGEFILPAAFEISLEDALAQGVENRIELELADINTQVMQIKYNAEKGNYLPNVALQANAALYTAADSYGIEADDFGTSYSIGIGIQIPLFTGFSNTAKRNLAKHDYLQSRLMQQDYEEMIRLQIRQDYQKLQYALDNYRVQTENIRLAERSLQLAQVRYDNQVGIQLEVFDAQTMLSAIKLQYFQAVYEVVSAQRNLQKSIGMKL